MREFVMPAGRFSGRRYVYMIPNEYRMFDAERSGDASGTMNLVVTNDIKRVKPRDMREIAELIRAIANTRDELNRTDTITLVSSQPLMWDWLTGLAMEGSLDYTIALAKNEAMFDIIGLPESELLLEVNDVRSALLINKMPIRQNVQCSIMCSAAKIHWLLGALKQSGRPDVSIYVNLKSLSPHMRGAST